ncbi:MAG TPA: class I SAM-dependent methyltransferase [Solirubrobacteraceae bacterium]|nr:class I SAM-dependent methyltransferase [Solirubrobacteraceae bacterium]
MLDRDYHEQLWESVPAGIEPPDFERRRRFLLERIERGERVLDVGCGEAWFTVELERTGAQPVGVDVAREPLRRAHAHHPNLDLRLLDLLAPWPLENASFDAAWAGEVIEHVADTAGWLSELRRVLRPGGKLLLSTPDHGRLHMLGLALSTRAFDAHFDPCSDHLRFYTRRTLTKLLHEFGFQDVELSRAGEGLGASRTLLVYARRSRF